MARNGEEQQLIRAIMGVAKFLGVGATVPLHQVPQKEPRITMMVSEQETVPAPPTWQEIAAHRRELGLNG